MRRPAIIFSLLLAFFFPGTTPNRAVHFSRPSQQDESKEITREDRLFVKALYARLHGLLSEEQEKYDEPYRAIKTSEYRLRKQINQTSLKRGEAETRLKLKKEDESELRRELKRAHTNEDRTRISKRLEWIEKERNEAEQELRTLIADEEALKDLLHGHLGLHFAEAKSLKNQIDRVSKQQMALLYKYGDWETSDKYSAYLALRDYMMKTAGTMALNCSVTIQSANSSGETERATIKYQTTEQRQFAKGLWPATTAKCPTRCSEDMKPHTYYIWTERNNKPSSDPDQIFVIAKPSESIWLQESSR